MNPLAYGAAKRGRERLLGVIMADERLSPVYRLLLAILTNRQYGKFFAKMAGYSVKERDSWLQTSA